MSRRMIVMLGLALAGPAWAQAEEAVEDETTAEPTGDMALGARLGMQFGVGGATPGGLRIGGAFLHRLADEWWFDGEASFSFGGGGMECDLAMDLECDHGLADGAGAQAIASVRWVLPAYAGGFEPYLRGGAGVGLASFGDDEVTGLALIGQAAGGGKFRVAERVSVGAEAALFIGPGFFSDDLGTLGYGGLIVQGGVEIDL
jgi:hypothetical protein